MIKNIIDILFPFYDNYKINKSIKLKMVDLETKDSTSIDLKELKFASDLSRVPLEMVKTTYNSSLERKKTIEDKAKINVLGVTLVVPLITAVSSSIIKLYSLVQIEIIKYILFLIGIAPIIYIVIGGILALEVLMNKNKIYMLYETEKILKKSLQKKSYAINIELNGYSNIIRTNYICTSYQCIRNGLCILLILFTIVLFPAINNNSQSNNNHLNHMVYPLDQKDYKMAAQTMQNNLNNNIDTEATSRGFQNNYLKNIWNLLEATEYKEKTNLT